MKKITFLLLVYLFTNQIIGQTETTRAFNLSSIIKLSDMTKENAHIWLTEDDFFTYVSNDSSGFIYGLNYDESRETASIWVQKKTTKGELFVQGKKSRIEFILKELKSKKSTSNLNKNGVLISIYELEKKELIVEINSKNEVSIEIQSSPLNESNSAKLKRHKKILGKN